MNKFIMRTYFKLTLLETDIKGYLPPLHTKFLEKFPHMQVSRQRVGDQRRTIVNNKILPIETINTIKDEVATELRMTNTQVETTNSDKSQPSNTQTQRMRWTTEYNETIIRAYFRITNLETDITAYRPQLHQSFIETFPHLSHLSEQRIADQRRVIMNNKLLTQERLDHIRQEIEAELIEKEQKSLPMKYNSQYF